MTSNPNIGQEQAREVVREFIQQETDPHCISVLRRVHAALTPTPAQVYPSLEMCVLFSDDGKHIRKWSRIPFDGGTNLYSHPVAGDSEAGRLRDALATAEAAIAEYYRYWTGGETRGSYDGKPERAKLWEAQRIARAALAGSK